VISIAAVGAALAGLAGGLSLIVAVGPQNTYVLRRGLQREHVLLIVAVCALSDVALIVAGVGGAGAVLRARPWLVTVANAGGAAFLLGYGLVAARRALRPTSTLGPDDTAGPISRREALGTSLAFTWLNPGVYVDTLVVLGPVSHNRAGEHWWFGAGAALGSVLWFLALGTGARLLASLFRSPRAWQVLDSCVALVMAFAAIRLLVEL
jgi:L-lysine exporter family protein LysE/ArgO